MKLNYVNHTDKNVKEYIKVINSIFKKIKDKRTFTIIFTTQDEIRKINNDYRNIDKVTDVISFALFDNDLSMYNASLELGDVFICVDRAISQAIDYGHSINREIGFLSVHGYLHLCGYDHLTKEEEEIMFNLQEEILEKAKLKRV